MSAILYTAATIHTLVPGTAAEPPARAVLVADGRVLATGDPRTLHRDAPAGTRIVDLGNGTVLPGFTDAHVHLTHLAKELAGADLRSATSEAECLRRIADHVATMPPDQWLFGGMWNVNLWSPPVQPTRHGLDAVTGARPVALVSSDGHTMWVNSAALTRLGITAHTPDPPGGQIVRDGAREATGILRESAVFGVRDLQDGPAGGDAEAMLATTTAHLLAQGVTSVHDVDGMAVLRAARRLRARGELHVRLCKLLPAAELDEHIAAGLRTGDGDDWIRIGQVKIFADGALGSHTCLMSHPFPAGTALGPAHPSHGAAGAPHEDHGVEVTAPDRLLHLLDTAIGHGLATAVHAIGDRANTQVLDAFERVAPASRAHGLRHRIEHAQFLRRSDLARLARLDVIASMQPQHYTADLGLQHLVPDAGLAAYAWRSVLESGATLAFGSDAPIEPPRPLHGIAAAIARWDAHGHPGRWQPEERLTARQAVAAYTTGATAASGESGVKGTLAPGMLADLVALDTDPLTAPPEAVRDAAVLATVVGGEVRWQR